MGRTLSSYSKTDLLQADQPQTLRVLTKSKFKLKSTKSQNLTHMPKDWNNNTILDNIFDQMEFKDVVKANSVCRQWHQLITPKIHRSLKLLRYRYVQNEYHLEEKNRKKLRNMEVMACIENNAKHKELVTHLNLKITIDAPTSKHLFSTFCHLSHLEFSNLPMTQDLILTCLRPLQSLVSLTFDSVRVTELVRKKFELEIVLLPATLKTLKLISLRSYRLPNLFKESMITHKNLEEFVYERNRYPELLFPFVNGYPTLKSLKLMEGRRISFLDETQNIIRSNPQLTEFTYISDSLDANIVNLITTNLTKLEILNLQEPNYTQRDTPIDIQFKNPMNLTSFKLNIKNLSPESYTSALNQIPNPTNLSIAIDKQFKRMTSIVRHKYTNLEHLTYYKPLRYGINNDRELEKEFIKGEINDTQYSCSTKLKSLNFCNLDMLTLEPLYLERFPNLELIQFVHPLGYGQRLESKTMLLDHLKTFSGWKFELKASYASVEGYLYRGKHITPKESLNRLCMYF